MSVITARPDSATVGPTAKGVWINLVANDTDSAGLPLDVTSVSQIGTLGTVVLNPTAHNGAWYEPGSAFSDLAPGQTATDTFSYTVTDSQGAVSTASVTVTIGSNNGFYVSKNGNDNWSGRLAQPNAAGTDGPLATLGAAQAKMEASSTIKTTYVEAGTYTGNLTLSSADSGETWSNYAGQTATLNASGSRIVNDFGGNNVTFSGLGIAGTSSNVYDIQISGASGVTVKDMTVTGGQTGILVSSGGGNSTVANNTLTGQTDYGVEIADKANNVTVNGNYIHDLGLTTAGTAIWFESTSGDVISNNDIVNIGKFGVGGGTIRSGDAATDNNVITHNTIDHANLDYPDAGAIDLFDDLQNSTGDTISYNTITNTSGGSTVGWIGPAIYLDNYLSGATVYGNLMENNIDGVWMHLGHNNTVSHNVVTGAEVGMALDGVVNNGIAELHAPTGDVFEYNTIYLANSSDHAMQINDMANEDAFKSVKFVDNVYGGPSVAADPFLTDINHHSHYYTFSQWQGLGFDTTAAAPSSSLTLAQAIATLPTS